MVPCFVLGEGCLTNVTSVCVRQGTNSFFYVAVVTAVGLGFELLPFLPFPFPWLLSEGERRRTGCRGSIPGRAGPHPFILPLPALMWQCAGSSLFAMALDRGRRMHSITEFPAFFPSGQRQNWMETKSRDLSSVVHTRSRFSKSLLHCVQVLTLLSLFNVNVCIAKVNISFPSSNAAQEPRMCIPFPNVCYPNSIKYIIAQKRLRN